MLSNTGGQALPLVSRRPQSRGKSGTHDGVATAGANVLGCARGGCVCLVGMGHFTGVLKGG